MATAATSSSIVEVKSLTAKSHAIRAGLACIAAASLSQAPAVHAAPTPIVVDVSADWEHLATKMILPAQLDTFHRSAIVDIGKQQLDLAATYRDDATKTEVTVYLFHAGLVDASVWHDRILAIMAAGRLGAVDQASARSSMFTPALGAVNSGIRTVVALSGKGVTSTGVAVFPSGDWLVSLRISSQALSPLALDSALAAFSSSMKLPPAVGMTAPSAYAIVPCSDALPTRKAKIYAPSMIDSMLGATASISKNETGLDTGAHAPKGAIWCRDPATTQDFGVYRANGSKQSYIVAFGDAGMTGYVARDSLAGLMGGPQSGYRLQVRTVDNTYIYPLFNRLPSVEQVTASVFQGAPIASATRGTAKSSINLVPTDTLK